MTPAGGEGGGVLAAPTIDRGAGLVYVGTGSSYGTPVGSAPGTCSLVALRIWRRRRRMARPGVPGRYARLRLQQRAGADRPAAAGAREQGRLPRLGSPRPAAAVASPADALDRLDGRRRADHRARGRPRRDRRPTGVRALERQRLRHLRRRGSGAVDRRARSGATGCRRSRSPRTRWAATACSRAAPTACCGCWTPRPAGRSPRPPWATRAPPRRRSPGSRGRGRHRRRPVPPGRAAGLPRPAPDPGLTPAQTPLSVTIACRPATISRIRLRT